MYNITVVVVRFDSPGHDAFFGESGGFSVFSVFSFLFGLHVFPVVFRRQTGRTVTAVEFHAPTSSTRRYHHRYHSLRGAVHRDRRHAARRRDVRQREPETRGRGAPPPSPPPPEDTAVAARVVPGHHAAVVLAAPGRLVQSGRAPVRFPRVSTYIYISILSTLTPVYRYD